MNMVKITGRIYKNTLRTVGEKRTIYFAYSVCSMLSLSNV